jgi:UDP-GlcNAc:undecaprenyl-phosphate/decaprenyl-phosphate GlcNAc-1-phosphate transferase
MVEYVPILMISFAASLGLTPLTQRLAQRIGMVDTPSARKVHRTPIPLLGGLAIYLAFVLAVIAIFALGVLGGPVGQIWQWAGAEAAAIMLCATWLAGLGFLDDRRELSPRAKFIGQLLPPLIMCVAGVRVDLFGVLPLDIALTFFWYVGIINAINFMDNMDGLAAGTSAIAAFFFFALAASQGQALIAAMSAALCGAGIGFLIYNFNPARTFMGDLGSLVLGYLLATIGLKLRFQTQVELASWMIPILVLAMPIFDTTLVVATRLLEKRSPMQGGKDHTSHRLVWLGLHTRLAVIAIYAASIVFGLSALAISQAPLPQALQIGALVALVALAAFAFLMRVRAKQRRAETAAKAS